MNRETFIKLPKKKQALIIESLPKQDKGVKSKIYGVGINDATHLTYINIEGDNIKHPAYVAWKEMLKRCYSEKYLMRRPSYAGAVVCDEWKYFSNFNVWWKQNYEEGYVLDKDILAGKLQKLYSPDFCIYVPVWINSFITFRDCERGEYPVGVHHCTKSNKYIAQCSENGERIYLGKYDTPEEAHCEWFNYKNMLLNTYKHALDKIDDRLYFKIKYIISNVN